MIFITAGKQSEEGRGMPAKANQQDTRAAVVAITLSVAALSLGDAVIKATGLSLPLWQMFIARSSLVVPVLWWLIRRRGSVTVSRPIWPLLRSVLLVAMWLSYYASLPLMPLSLAAAAYYTGPLFIVAIAAMVGRRWPSGRAMIAVACGFVGVWLIVRPDTAGFSPEALLPVVAAVLYASAMVLTSAKCQSDDPLVLALVLHGVFIISGALLGLFAGHDGSLILGPWQPLDMRLMATILALAGLILVGSVGAAIAYQKGPPATVAAFDYSYLAFSLNWGGLFFGEVPGLMALVGISLIVVAGLLALQRTPG
ncbi:MAG: DMT family transporter [Pseudomonadota bacterium]